MTPPPSPRTVRIVVVNAAAGATIAAALRSALPASGYDIVAALPADVFLAERIARLEPDMIVIDSAADPRAVLDHIMAATRDAPRAMVLFTDDAAPASMEAALDAGVSAYIVAGLRAERVKPVLDLAMARFRREQTLRGELRAARRQLAERKLVERAKGILMARKRMSEDQAYHALRGMAMNSKLRLAEVAQRILDLEDLL